MGDGISELLFHRLFASKMSSQSLGREYCLSLTDEVRETCDEIVVYEDFGTESSGVRRAIQLGEYRGIPVVYKKLPPSLIRHVWGQSFLSTVVPLVNMAIIATGTVVCAKRGGVWVSRGFRFFRSKWNVYHNK